MVTLEYGSGEIVEASVAGLAAISLPVRLSLILPVLDHLGTFASNAVNSFGPPQVSNGLKALGIINEAFNFQDLAWNQASDLHERSSEVWGAQDTYLNYTKMSSLFKFLGASYAANPESIKSHKSKGAQP